MRSLHLILTCILATACTKQPEATAPVYTPSESLELMEIAEDYAIELVASEPMVEDPVAMTFDEMGRLWIVEMRGYMPNIDQHGEELPVGRIKVLIDNNRDGRMDESKVFLDSLVLPRSLAVVKGGILVAEQFPLWFVPDEDGDLKADRKILIDSTYGNTGMPEHSPNGLWRGMDNWYYNAKSTFRYAWSGKRWIKDSTEFRGQWGISHDDYGRLYYNYNWSQLHGDLVPPNYLGRNKNHIATSGIDHGLTIDRKIFPIRPNLATNRGYIGGTLDESGKLLEFTSACSPFVYRGDALPDLQGDVLVAEPAGNLIKRNQVDNTDPIISASSPYSTRDFLASRDERFRPVFFATGPDGALYFADMYRGLIEHGPYMSEYLREQTLLRGLESPVHLGRIWRIVPKNFTQPKILLDTNTTIPALVDLLSHENGWYRDVAQRLLVERGDAAAVPFLEQLIRTSDNPLAQLHAMYTLDGLDRLNPAILYLTLIEGSPHSSTLALRLIEQKFGRDPVQTDRITQFVKQNRLENKFLALQIALSATMLPSQTRVETLKRIFTIYGHLGLYRDAILSSLQDQEMAMLLAILNENKSDSTSKEIFIEHLSAAIYKGGNTHHITRLLDLPHRVKDWQMATIIRGLALATTDNKPILQLSHQPAVFNDPHIRSAAPARLEKIKNALSWPGHYPDTTAHLQSKALTPEQQQLFVQGRKHYITSCAGCHGNEGEGLRRSAPPLVQSEWVLGDQSRLVLLVLHGIEGPITVRGKEYKSPDILPVMPSHSVLDDRVIASILTYIRHEWGHDADPISAGTVGRLRHHTQGRVQPWSVQNLDEHVFNLNQSE